jgi:hypothetical protein
MIYGEYGTDIFWDVFNISGGDKRPQTKMKQGL